MGQELREGEVNGGRIGDGMTTETAVGKELDALIAIEVMGWHRMSWKDWDARVRPAGHGASHTAPDERTSLTYAWHDKDNEMVINAEDDTDYYNPSEAWSPSTDIAAAWQVVERMRELGLRVEVHAHPNGTNSALCESVTLVGHQIYTGFKAVPTASEAICRAALAAVRGA